MTTILPKVSDANHWMKCHGSVQAQAQFPALPGEVSQSRLEGRACHEVAKKLLTAERHGWPLPELVGTLSACQASSRSHSASPPTGAPQPSPKAETKKPPRSRKPTAST